MTTDTCNRAFYFLFEQNEPQAVDETYTFVAEVTANDGLSSQSVCSASGNFVYKPFPKENEHVSSEPYREVPASGLSSSQLPAVVAFAADVPVDVPVEASVTAFDQYQQHNPVSVAALGSYFLDCIQDEPITSLPLLPARPRIFVKPITYEFLTTDDRPLDARVRVVVEDVTGMRPCIEINSNRHGVRETLSDRALAPFRYDLIISARLSPPYGLGIDVNVANAYEPVFKRYAKSKLFDIRDMAKEALAMLNRME